VPLRRAGARPEHPAAGAADSAGTAGHHDVGLAWDRRRPAAPANDPRSRVSGRPARGVHLARARGRLHPAAVRARPRPVGRGAAETLQRAMGDPDTVSVGDYHLPSVVVHLFTGRPRGTDEEMLELLAPWAGQRQRVMRLVEAAGIGAPRFGPRFRPLDARAI